MLPSRIATRNQSTRHTQCLDSAPTSGTVRAMSDEGQPPRPPENWPHSDAEPGTGEPAPEQPAPTEAPVAPTQPNWGQPAGPSTWGAAPPNPSNPSSPSSPSNPSFPPAPQPGYGSAPSFGPQDYGPQGYGPPGYGPPPPSTGGLRPLEIGEVLDGGFRLWWRTLKPVLPYSILLSIPVQVIALMVSLWTISIKNNTDGQLFQSQQDRNAAIGAGVVSILILLILPTVLQGSLTAYFTDRLLNRDTPIKACLGVGFRRLLPLVAVAFIVAFASGIGVLACCVGLFFVTTRLAVAGPVCVVERAGPIKSISRSWDLTETRFWPTLAIVVFNLVVPGLLSGIVGQIVSGILTATVSERAGAFGTFGVGIIASGLITPLTTAIVVVMYLDLRVRREGLDLQLAAQGLAIPQ
jgi:hypothetical protein